MSNQLANCHNFKSNIKKVLHISFHRGCQNDIQYICDTLGLELSFMEFNDGTRGKYNIGKERAQRFWDKHTDYFNSFDIIITSDTAPISRVFLQNNFKNRLIIWICNRVDYFDAASLDCDFPDRDYYDLLNSIKDRHNISIIGYTPFENYYCSLKNIHIGNQVIKPIGITSSFYNILNETNIIHKKDQFFVPSYHNDTIMINLKDKLLELGISAYCGKYNGPLDLKDYRGIIHIPYAWSNLALFENLQNNLIYFIPSKQFLIELKKDKDFFWSPPYIENKLDMSEWYCEDLKNVIVYFDSWDDLINKINTIDYANQKNIISNFCKIHTKNELKKWQDLLSI
jgi:hypothetical protein